MSTFLILPDAASMYVLQFQGWLWHDYAHRYRRTTSHLPPYRSTGDSMSSQWKQPHKEERVLAKAQKTQIRGLVCVLFYLLFLFSLSLSLPLLYPPFALFFSLASSSLGSHAGLWREGTSIRGMHTVADKDTTHHIKTFPRFHLGLGKQNVSLGDACFLHWDNEN